MKKILLSKKVMFCVLGFIVTYLLFFHNMWAYDLMDVDETRYIDMARHMIKSHDYLTLYMNGNYFFEKPPLFFWIENIGFLLFGKVSSGLARLPIAIEALLACCAVYYACQKAVSKKFGLVAAIIAGSCLEFLILSKVAILDMLLTSCITISTFAGLTTFFVSKENKKYFWWIFYIFSALGVMAKGIPAFIVPFGTMFFAGLYTKKLKEYFRPIYMLPGILVFLLIVIPWHYVMLAKYKHLFFDEYIILHHVKRFLGSAVLDKNRPFYYYFAVVIWGFFPWIFSFIPALVNKIKGFKFTPYESLTQDQQFVALNAIGLVFTFLFFTSSSSKLVTYILPVYPFMAVLLADYWLKKGFSKGLKYSSIILSSIILFVGIGGCFLKFVMPNNLYEIIKEAQSFSCILCLVIGGLSFYYIKKSEKTKLFATYFIFMTLFSAFGAYHLFNIDYKFGQDDLENFAVYAKDTNRKLGSWNTGRKYSLTYMYEDNVTFLVDVPSDTIKPLLDNNYLVIVRNKDMDEIQKGISYKIIATGAKYSLIEKLN